jgi:hypothetical protein
MPSVGTLTGYCPARREWRKIVAMNCWLVVAVLGAAEQFVGVRAVARHGRDLSVEAGQASRLSEPFSALLSSYQTNSGFARKYIARTDVGRRPSGLVS